MAENKTVEDIIQNWRQIGIRAGTVTCWQFGMWADRLERAWKQERQEWQRGLLEDMLTAEQVRANAGLLVDWNRGPKSARHARVLVDFPESWADICADTSSYEVFRQERPAPQWVPKKDEQVCGYVGVCKIIGPYDYRTGVGTGHLVGGYWVDRVEPLAKEDAE